MNPSIDTVPKMSDLVNVATAAYAAHLNACDVHPARVKNAAAKFFKSATTAMSRRAKAAEQLLGHPSRLFVR